MPRAGASEGIEHNSHSFVVTIWTEQETSPRLRTELRGQITHAYTKDRGVVTELSDILEFIRPYVTAMGVRLPVRSRLALTLGTIGLRRKKTMTNGTR